MFKMTKADLKQLSEALAYLRTRMNRKNFIELKVCAYTAASVA
jgi:hypothetical protein